MLDRARAGTPADIPAPRADHAATELLRDVAAPDLFGTEAVSASVRFDPLAWTPDRASRLGIDLPRQLAAAAARRKVEFVAGRFCAREALVRLGRPAGTTIPSNGRGAPVWPPGIVGSITHSGDFASAAVALQSAVLGLGIDSERIMAPGRAVRLAAEICAFETPEAPAGCRAHALHVTLVFSAKESLFKCLHPLVGREFGFADAHVGLGAARGGSGSFAAMLLTDLGAGLRRGFRLGGRYLVDPPYVHTGIALRPTAF